MIKKIFTTFPFIFCLLFAAIAQPGSMDKAFNPGSGADKNIYDIALQQDGKIIIAGDFTNYNSTNRYGIARLNADGSLDPGFYPGKGIGENESISTIVIQSDNKVLITGNFKTYNGIACNNIIRINADGSQDNTFNPGTGPDTYIDDIYLQPDGKILIAGNFTSFNGSSYNCITRLNADGSLDANFKPGTGAGGEYPRISSIVLQPDKKIIIGGSFTFFNGINCNRLARLNTDGSLDRSFNFNEGYGADNSVAQITLQPDGKIIIGGVFDKPRNSLARLNPDGSIDTGFITSTHERSVDVYRIILQPDGKIIISERFFSPDGVGLTIHSISRLNTDGSIDTGFNTGTGADSYIFAIALQPDGKILAGGMFSNFNNTAAKGVVRINGK